MKAITVPGIEIQIPTVGFGCSGLSGVGEKAALDLLAAAFDAGVRHFDVARYYGYGEAEGILGKFLKARRSEVTVTTKFGINPPRRTSALRLAMQAGRRVVRVLPGVRKFAQRRAQALVQGGGFSVAEAQSSLETSLRELGTGHLDFYLLHDYAVSGQRPDKLLAFLTQAVQAGKIRYFGLGSSIQDVVAASEQSPELCQVVQFENSVLKRNIQRLAAPQTPRLAITHGALAESFRSLWPFLEAHGEVVRNWSTVLNIDCSRKETISALMLNYAAWINPGGLVLFSTQKASRVRANVKSVLDPDISEEQAKLFGQLVERDALPLLSPR